MCARLVCARLENNVIHAVDVVCLRANDVRPYNKKGTAHPNRPDYIIYQYCRAIADTGLILYPCRGSVL